MLKKSAVHSEHAWLSTASQRWVLQVQRVSQVKLPPAKDFFPQQKWRGQEWGWGRLKYTAQESRGRIRSSSIIFPRRSLPRWAQYVPVFENHCQNCRILLNFRHFLNFQNFNCFSKRFRTFSKFWWGGLCKNLCFRCYFTYFCNQKFAPADVASTPFLPETTAAFKKQCQSLGSLTLTNKQLRTSSNAASTTTRQQPFNETSIGVGKQPNRSGH